MRTLKKTLSLVLVVAMVLGLCVVGASAKNAVDDFTDADKIGAAYTEAVGVMTGIGVIKGMGDGTLSPTGNYTRAQAAKIITYMLIGEKAAESLVCTTAPFEDVAANHWAAGYIAFCVEQGIINGMSATTFDPEGPLTGFQWAKMLLCAVGFGSQGEFTGNSWSLNTAKVAHSVGVFAGDLAGADHVALQRQQAILYAFNVLTTVPQVTYAPGITGYIEGVVNYKPVTDLGKTLGESVYKLYNVTGVIVDNEAMGNGTTDVAASYTGVDVANIKASTGLDMMWHAAKIWYVEGTKANTGVCVIDLAKTETTTCPSGAASTKQVFAIGETPVDDDKVSGLYERNVVDNGDYGKVTVDVYYAYGKLGVASTVKSTQVIDGYVAANADIMTDISAMAYGDSVIYLYAESTTSDGEAWYVYAPTATTGVVSKVDSKGTVTLRDGTEIAQSNLSVQSADANPIETTQAYVFVLDTHGHYISAVPTYNLVYYTGSYSRTFGEYVGEETYTAQVISTDDGSVSRVPVLGSWWGVRGDAGDAGQDNLFGIDEAVPGYYVLGEPTTDGFYRPTLWLANTNPVAYNTTVSGKAYDNSENFFVNKTKLTDASGNVYDFAADEVEFIIVTGTGSNLSIATYTGVAEMLAGVGDAATTSAVLSNMAITFEVTEFGNRNVLKVFSADVDYRSTYLFIPYDIELTDGAWRQETGFGGVAYGYENAAYLNGSAEPVTLVFRSKTALDRGFYSYEVDAAGYYRLTPVAASEWRYEAESIGRRGTSTYYQTSTITGMPASVEFPIADDVVVFDVRLGALAKEVDAISTLNALAINEAPNYVPQLAYTFNTDGEIAVIYVVEQNLGKVEVGADADSWTEASKWTIDDVKCVEGDKHDFEDVVSFTLTPKTGSGITLTEGAVLSVDLKVVVNNTSTTKTATVDATVGKDNVVTVNVDMKKVFGVSGDYWYNITVEDVVFKTFYVSTETTGFTVQGAGTDGKLAVVDLAPGEELYVKFYKATVAANLDIDYTINGTRTGSVKSRAGVIQLGFNRTAVEPKIITSNEDLVINFTVDYTIDLGNKDNDIPMYFNFANEGSAANEDVLEVKNCVPGNPITFKIETDKATDEGYLLQLASNSTTLKSNNASVQTDGSTWQVFTFTFVPVVNDVRISGSNVWFSGTQNIWVDEDLLGVTA